MDRTRRLLLATAALILFGAGAWFMWLRRPELPVANPNGPPPVALLQLIPEDLQVDTSELPPDKNGLSLTLEALATGPPLSAADEGALRPKSPNAAPMPASERRRLLKLLDSRSRFHAEIERIVTNYPFRSPLPGGLYEDTTYLALRPLRTFCSELAGACRLRLAEGRVPDAVATAFQQLRIALALSKAEGSSMEEVIYRSVLNQTLSTIRGLMAVRDISAEQVAKLLAAMPVDLSLNGAVYAMKMDLYMLVKYVESCSLQSMFGESGISGGRQRTVFRHRNPFDRKQTAELLIQLHREGIADIQAGFPVKPHFAARQEALSDLPSLDDLWLVQVLGDADAYVDTDFFQSPQVAYAFWESVAGSQNPLGRMFACSASYYEEGSRRIMMQGLADYRLTRLLCALRLYQKRFGEYPDTLLGLTKGGVLKAELLDPMTGKPFYYNKAAKRLWAVGRDGRNDGGTTRNINNLRAGPDAVVVLP